MQYEGCKSDTYKCASGVTQGSNLRLLMFIIFVSGLVDYCKINERVQLYLYADDVKIAHVVKNERNWFSLGLYAWMSGVK